MIRTEFEFSDLCYEVFMTINQDERVHRWTVVQWTPDRSCALRMGATVYYANYGVKIFNL